MAAVLYKQTAFNASAEICGSKEAFGNKSNDTPDQTDASFDYLAGKAKLLRKILRDREGEA
jgi:hypothetical protein